MNQLQVIDLKGKLVTDSREVAEMIEKDHSHLLRDIRNYITILGKSKIGFADFFIESFYNDSQGKPRPHFYLTKKGCDMVANKMTGEKGVLFTAAYVTKFEEMENKLVSKPKSQLEILQMSINQIIEQEKQIQEIKQENNILKNRIDNLDHIDTIGDLQQRLNKMIRKYAANRGLSFPAAWKDFRQAFNLAFRTNITMLVENYKLKYGKKQLTVPEYLAEVDRLEDAIRVADKLLNQAS